MFENQIKEYLKKNSFKEFSPKAVFFDMDGVLYNSMPNHAISWHNSMKKYGLLISEDEAYLYEGMRGVETIKLLALKQWNRTLDDETAKQMYAYKSSLYSSCPKADKIPDVELLMKKIKDQNLKILVVTGSGQRTLLDKIEEDFLGLIQKDYIISSKDVKHGKPNPEPYLFALERAKVHPYEAIIIENAPLGVRSGVASRVFTIAVNTGPLKDEVLLQEGANLIFPNMYKLLNVWDNISLSLSLEE